MANKRKHPRQIRMKFNLIKVAGFFKVVLAVLTIALMHAIIDFGLNNAEQIMAFVDAIFQNLLEFDFDLVHILILLVGAGTFIWGHFLKKRYPQCGKWLTITSDVFTIALFAAHTMFDYSAGSFLMTYIAFLIFHFITIKAHRGEPIILKIILVAIGSWVGVFLFGAGFDYLDSMFHIMYFLTGEQLAFGICWLTWIILYIVQLVAVLKKPRY